MQQRGSATIEYREDGSVIARLGNHGLFCATAAGFKFASGRPKSELVAAIAAAYADNPSYSTKRYWAQYPVDALRVVSADHGSF